MFLNVEVDLAYSVKSVEGTCDVAFGKSHLLGKLLFEKSHVNDVVFDYEDVLISYSLRGTTGLR